MHHQLHDNYSIKVRRQLLVLTRTSWEEHWLANSRVKAGLALLPRYALLAPVTAMFRDEQVTEAWRRKLPLERLLMGYRCPVGKAGPSRNLFTPQGLSDKVEPRLPCRRRQAVLARPIPLALQPIGRALS